MCLDGTHLHQQSIRPNFRAERVNTICVATHLSNHFISSCCFSSSFEVSSVLYPFCVAVSLLFSIFSGGCLVRRCLLVCHFNRDFVPRNDHFNERLLLCVCARYAYLVRLYRQSYHGLKKIL